MGVELVENQDDPLSLGIVNIDEVLDAVGEIASGALIADADAAPAAQRFGDHEEIGDATTHVFGIVAVAIGGRVSPSSRRLVSSRQTTG